MGQLQHIGHGEPDGSPVENGETGALGQGGIRGVDRRLGFDRRLRRLYPFLKNKKHIEI
jgi:hypothetical protein